MSKLIKEQWSRLAFGKGNSSINESADVRTQVDHIVQETIDAYGPDSVAGFYSRLAHATGHSHFLAMFTRNIEVKETYIEFMHACDNNRIDIAAALGYVREKYAIPHEVAQTKADQAAEPEMGYSDFNAPQWYGASL
jgi:hypothetical protein